MPRNLFASEASDANIGRRPLLLPAAKSGVLIEKPRPNISRWWRRVALALGLVAVLIGGADATARFAERFLGDDATFSAFAPATLLLEPELQGEVRGAVVEAFVPVRVVVPAIGVDASVEEVGQTSEGAMATPKALANVGWYKLGAKPGGQGSAVFAGHVNNALGFPGVFKELSQVKEGDTVTVVGELGQRLVYQVESITLYEESGAPLEEIFNNTGPSRVVLITCEGEWDTTARTFDKRLVVVAQLLNP